MSSAKKQQLALSDSVVAIESGIISVDDAVEELVDELDINPSLALRLLNEALGGWYVRTV